MRDACQPSSVRTTSAIMKRMKSASPRCEPSKRRGRTTLRIQTATAIPASTARMKTSTSAMNQPCAPSHGNDQSRSIAPIIAITIVGKRTRKPQKISACIAPGHEPLEQLPLAEHDRRLVLDAPRDVVGAVERPRRTDEPHEEERAPREQPAGDGEQRRKGDGAGDGGYEPLTFLSSAVIAGTISCRSPITA